jgi:hypothetical protein
LQELIYGEDKLKILAKESTLKIIIDSIIFTLGIEVPIPTSETKVPAKLHIIYRLLISCSFYKAS